MFLPVASLTKRGLFFIGCIYKLQMVYWRRLLFRHLTLSLSLFTLKEQRPMSIKCICTHLWQCKHSYIVSLAELQTLIVLNFIKLQNDYIKLIPVQTKHMEGLVVNKVKPLMTSMSTKAVAHLCCSYSPHLRLASALWLTSQLTLQEFTFPCFCQVYQCLAPRHLCLGCLSWFPACPWRRFRWYPRVLLSLVWIPGISENKASALGVKVSAWNWHQTDERRTSIELEAKHVLTKKSSTPAKKEKELAYKRSKCR